MWGPTSFLDFDSRDMHKVATVLNQFLCQTQARLFQGTGLAPNLLTTIPEFIADLTFLFLEQGVTLEQHLGQQLDASPSCPGIGVFQAEPSPHMVKTQEA